MLKPVSGTGRVSSWIKWSLWDIHAVQQIKMNKKFGDDVPKVDATLLFDELSFIIDNEQYRDAVLMVDLFHSYLKRQKVRRKRIPNNKDRPSTHHFLLVPSSSSRGRRYA